LGECSLCPVLFNLKSSQTFWGQILFVIFFYIDKYGLGYVLGKFFLRSGHPAQKRLCSLEENSNWPHLLASPVHLPVKENFAN
jgi:hypothetical protein